MHFFATALLSLVFFTNPWSTNFEQAQQTASTQKQLILLNFSGSDWCAPCKRMKREVFEDTTFQTYASQHLVLLSADFPRLRKNILDKTQQAHNDRLAERYNKEGKFPYTVLLDAAGKVLKTWEGFPAGGAAKFIEDLKAVRP